MPTTSKIRINGVVFESAGDESLINDIKDLKDELVLELMPSALASFVLVRDMPAGTFAIKLSDNEYAVLDTETSEAVAATVKAYSRVNKIHESISTVNKYMLALLKDCVMTVCGLAMCGSLTSDGASLHVMTARISDANGNVVEEYDTPVSLKVGQLTCTSMLDTIACAVRLADAIKLIEPVEQNAPGYSRASSNIQYSIS